MTVRDSESGQGVNPDQVAPKPRRSFGTWLWIGSGAVVGTADVMMFFAVAWVASGLGPGASAVINILITLPRTVLLLFGGAIGDRFGPRPVLIGTDGLRAAVLAIGAITVLLIPPSLFWLAPFTLALGIISAFSIPAAHAMPRLFATTEELPKLMARVGGLSQLGRLIGPPLGGLVLGLWSTAAVFGIDLIGALIMIIVLLIIRPPYESPPVTESGSILRQTWRGLREAARTPGIPPLYGATALVAAGVLPVLFLCLPLLARERGWSAATTGWIEGCWIAGSLVITGLIGKWGILRRAGWVMIIGPVVAGCGGLLLALAGSIPTAMAASALMGVGTIVFTGHLGPLLMHWTPPDMVARFQSLFVLVQSAPQVITTVGLGAVAEVSGAGAACASAGVVCAAGGVVVAASSRLRAATRPVSESGAVSASGTGGLDSNESE